VIDQCVKAVNMGKSAQNPAPDCPKIPVDEHSAYNSCNADVILDGLAPPAGDPADFSLKPSGEALDIGKIDYGDPAVYKMISKGHTIGVFQLESAGMTRFMKDLKPGNIEDIIAGVALYRPGPMDFIPQYINGKNNPDKIRYDCAQLIPILTNTYGVIVYQEQVMQIVRELGGYSLGRSDLVRRAMSKKKQDVMEKEKANFVYGNSDDGIPGCVARGIDEQTAIAIFDKMMDFARYAFNKSHAAAYAIVAYQTAYLMCHYPKEFMAAMLTSVMDYSPSLTAYVRACKAMNIDFVNPDINEGEADFAVRNGKIVYALSAVKGVGRGVIKDIVRERETGGKFKDLSDFLKRCRRLDPEKTGSAVNKKAVENFIKAGAFDCFNMPRKSMMSRYEALMDNLNKSEKARVAGQMSLFDLPGMENMEREYFSSLHITEADAQYGEYNRRQLLEYEKEVLGFYCSGHPLDEDIKLIKHYTTADSSQFMISGETGLPAIADEANVTVGGLVEAVRTKTTRSNKLMAFVTLGDIYGSLEVLVFPADWEQYRRFLENDAKVFVDGRVSWEEGKDAKLICRSVKLFEDMPGEVWLKFSSRDDFCAKEAGVKECVGPFPGKDSLVAYIASDKKMRYIGGVEGVSYGEVLRKKLENLLGAGNVIKRF